MTRSDSVNTTAVAEAEMPLAASLAGDRRDAGTRSLLRSSTAADADLTALLPAWEAARANYDRTCQQQTETEIAANADSRPGPAPEKFGPEWEAWHARSTEWRERTGIIAAEEASGVALRALAAIEDRIAALPATTLAGLRLKALVAQRNDDIGVDWPDMLGEGLTRDLLALGADERGLPPSTGPVYLSLAHQPDPILAAIAASRQAEADMEAFERRFRRSGITAEERVEENALADRQTVARATVFGIVPTTDAGRKALVDYIRYQSELSWGADWRARALTDEFGEMFLSLYAVVEAGLPAPTSDLTKSIMEGWAAWGATLGACDDDAEGTAAYEKALGHRDALLDAAEVLPATLDNIAAKALARLWMDWVEDERPSQPREAFSFDGRLAFDVNAAIMGHVAPVASLPKAHQVRPSLDLRDASINQLARFHDCLQSLALLVSVACNAPMAWDGRDENHNSIGHFLSAECDRLDTLAEHVVDQIKARSPTSNHERDDRLATIVKRQMEVFMAIDDKAVMAEATAAWGA